MFANKLLYLPLGKILWKEGDMHDCCVCTHAYMDTGTLCVSIHVDMYSCVYYARCLLRGALDPL